MSYGKGGDKPSQGNKHGTSTLADVAHSASILGGQDERQSKQATDLIEQGRLFLLDHRVVNASEAAKTAFLEGKGLSQPEIQKALKLASVSQQHDDSASPSVEPTSIQPSRSDAPPIITYPEFLINASRPPPLITAQRLLNLAYLVSAISATFYGTSRFIIRPMTASLTEARHDLASHATGLVEDLNSRLGDTVSEHVKSLSINAEAPDSDDGDPNEFFHRDFGTQTEPALLDDKSTSSASDTDITDSNTNYQSSKMYDIISHARALHGDDIHEAETSHQALMSMRALHESIESMAYPSFPTTNSGHGPSYMLTESQRKDGDEVVRFRQEIRSLKGTLLNARNFPGRRATLFPPSRTTRQG